MKNGMAISTVSRQLKLVCERIDTLSMDIEQLEQSNSGLVNTYVNLRLGELEHAQVLTLRLTELITQEKTEEPNTNADEGGSVFAAGDLNATGKELEVENADCALARD